MSIKTINFCGKNYKITSLKDLGKKYGVQLEKVPFSIRILLEAVARRKDDVTFLEKHIKALAQWSPKKHKPVEIPYIPARVLLQDFTGVPAVVDLAAMRDAAESKNASPDLVNPLIPCDLVIDHSVQVDHAGSSSSLELNEKLEFKRNLERYELLKWAQQSFDNFRVIPPSTGIVHQVNLEHLSQVVIRNDENDMAYPDSCVGTDSHTPMVNGIGVLSWGVGGIEAEAVMLEQPISMLIPEVIGIELRGKLKEGVTATDLVLSITERCREYGVVGKFVEFFGKGLDELSPADRATIANMAPEHGCTACYFPVDEDTLQYLELTGKSKDHIEFTKAYLGAQDLFRTNTTPNPEFTDIIVFDLDKVGPSLAGPKRPQDRIPISKMKNTWGKTLLSPRGPKGFGLDESELKKSVSVKVGDSEFTLTHGCVLIAAITSCTNTSNPSVMLGAGLLAKKAVEKGLKTKLWVKTSLAPGSRVVTEYLEKAGLLSYLECLGFYVVGYGCTTCIGNSGPLPESIESAVIREKLIASAVISGNRNFEGRINRLTKANFLASPPLVVAYAIFGNTSGDITKDSLGQDAKGNDVFLKDIWPSNEELRESLRVLENSPDLFSSQYSKSLTGPQAWQSIKASASSRFKWDESSTYVRKPSFFEIDKTSDDKSIIGAKTLGLFGDSVTTDHISPAGAIAEDSPAGQFLLEKGVSAVDFNSYGSRRGNHLVMMRGTFANPRLRNLMIEGSEGNVTLHIPTNKQMSFFEAAEIYKSEKTPLILIAGKEYGTGSSRDWAAKGPALLGIKAVIAETYERIHRSNLIGMGIIPLQFQDKESPISLGLNGLETFNLLFGKSVSPRQQVNVEAIKDSGEKISFKTICRIDTPVESEYIRRGGILPYVLDELIEKISG